MPERRGRGGNTPAPFSTRRDREVAVANRHPHLRLNRREVARVIALLDAHAADIGVRPADVPPGELSLVFLTDGDLADLHAQFLDDPSTTDVITFEGEPGHGIAGEICVSVDTASHYARDHGHSFADELTLYVVHGWLHLAGHDDLVPAKKRMMRRAEGRAMKVLAKAKAVPRFQLEPGTASPATHERGRQRN